MPSRIRLVVVGALLAFGDASVAAAQAGPLVNGVGADDVGQDSVVL